MARKDTTRLYPWSIEQTISGIKLEEEHHGVCLSIGVHEFRGNVNVKYADGYTNSWRGDADEIQRWGDELLMRTALRRSFPDTRIRFWTSGVSKPRPRS